MPSLSSSACLVPEVPSVAAAAMSATALPKRMGSLSIVPSPQLASLRSTLRLFLADTFESSGRLYTESFSLTAVPQSPKLVCRLACF